MDKTQPHKRRAINRQGVARTQVPDQYFGYSLQAIRLLHMLLEAGPGVTVCLEVFEDVGQVEPSGSTLASQVKSGLVKNPISDRAVDLWKTFANWVAAVEDGSLDPEATVFEIYLGKKHRGKFAECFDSAATEAEALAALEAARVALFGNGKRPKALAQELDDHVKRVFAADRTMVSKII